MAVHKFIMQGQITQTTHQTRPHMDLVQQKPSKPKLGKLILPSNRLNTPTHKIAHSYQQEKLKTELEGGKSHHLCISMHGVIYRLAHWAIFGTSSPKLHENGIRPQPSVQLGIWQQHFTSQFNSPFSLLVFNDYSSLSNLSIITVPAFPLLHTQ